MVDHDQTTMTVCCLCGDIGFSDKLFRCSRCRWRFQHSYCSNYYHGESSDQCTEVCDWCRSEERTTNSLKYRGSPKNAIAALHPSERLKHNQDREGSGSGTGIVDKGKNSGGSSTGVSSPRTGTRRYKLLKDVMC
ncbi:hypothetical protein AKJ16_DCAP12641 [Drosera capensis]